MRRRPTSDELERARRQFLSQFGRLVDGLLLNLFETEADDGRTHTMLVFSYQIAGVNYECSQDVTTLGELMDNGKLRVGFPCAVRYQPGNPHNSIVLAEQWTGLGRALSSTSAAAAPTTRTA